MGAVVEESGGSERLANLEVRLGRGVAQYVNRNGGHLFLWGEPYGTGFYALLAGTQPPDGLDFVRSRAMPQFELYLETGLQLGLPISLARRWFGLRSGIVAVTPASMAGPVGG